MERLFDFEVYDVVRLKGSDEKQTALIDGSGTKEYREHLEVAFRFWDGCQCCYVLNTGDDGICLICDEDSLELEEKAPMPTPEEVQPEPAKESYFLGYVYRINNRLVAAESLEKTIELFRSHPSHQNETIETIGLQSQDLALIQNGEEE